MSKKVIVSALALLAFSVSPAFSADVSESATAPQTEAPAASTSTPMASKVLTGKNEGYNHPGMTKRVLPQYSLQHALNSLSPKQKQALETLTQSYIDKTNPLYVELATKTAEYNALLLNDNPNVKTAGQLAGEITKLGQQLEAEENSFLKTIAEKYKIYMTGGM